MTFFSVRQKPPGNNRTSQDTPPSSAPGGSGNSFFRTRPAKGLLFWAVAALFFLYGLLSLSGRFSPCFFYNVLGMPCPGCGMSRAYLALAQGLFRDAFFFHPLFFLPPVLLLLFYLQFVREKKIPNLLWISLAALFVSVYLARLILLFPDTKPMNFNPNALLPKLAGGSFLAG